MLAALYSVCLAVASTVLPDVIIDSARDSGSDHPAPSPLVGVVRSPHSAARFMTFGRSVVGAQFLVVIW